MKYVDIIVESKENIINLGFPRVLASLFYKNFGKHAYLFAKWFKDYHAHRYADDPNWFKIIFDTFYDKPNKWDLVQLYNATDSIENYLKARKRLSLYVDLDDIYDEEFLLDQRQYLLQEINEDFFKKGSSIFRYYSLPKDIISGKLKDLNRYKNLKFLDAQKLYDQYQIFEKTKPLKIYKTGFRWINVGPKCTFLGDLMKNCGSAGVMGDDPDRTIIALFDQNNIPHVVVTYSPNQNKLSGDEGIASTAVKSKYHKYVLDLSNVLNAELSQNSKSRLLYLRSLLKNRATNIVHLSKEPSDGSSATVTMVKFNLNGITYYSNTYKVITKEDLDKIINAIKLKKIEFPSFYRQGGKITIKNIMLFAFHYLYADALKSIGVVPKAITQLL